MNPMLFMDFDFSFFTGLFGSKEDEEKEEKKDKEDKEQKNNKKTSKKETTKEKAKEKEKENQKIFIIYLKLVQKNTKIIFHCMNRKNAKKK